MSITAEVTSLPPALRTIYEEVARGPRERDNLVELRCAWDEYLARAQAAVPGLRSEHGGETIALGELSPGCRACKTGAWDCLFVTMRCNLDCAFCYSPQGISRDYVGSAYGATPADIAAQHARTHIEGIAFSGGEPFLEVERLCAWLGWFKEHSPARYYWVYTNGLLATESHLQRLAELGLDEIRFNLAATDYTNPVVLQHLAAAAHLLPRVTIEIPAIPEHADKVLASLATWSARGVRHLNLHELLYEPLTNAANMTGARCAMVLPDGHRCAFNPASRELTLAVMSAVCTLGLPLAVNDCSMQSKLRQLRMRRRALAPLVQAPYERWLEDGFYERCAAYRGAECIWLPPDDSAVLRARYPDHRLVRLVRTAPLAVGDRGHWIAFEWLN
jgi:uncharacterized protein